MYKSVQIAVAKTQLPIDKYKKEILTIIHNNEISVFESFTGSGKTLRIPQFILEDDALAKIAITQPRRIATITVADKVAEERGVKVGGREIGYKISMDQKLLPSTSISYMTTGTLLQILIHKRRDVRYSHIIIDEVHVRDLQTDLLLLVMKKLHMENRNWDVKIILLSATIDVDSFFKYFKYSDKVGHLRITTKEKLYPIHENYIKDIERMGVFGFSQPDLNELRFDVGSCVAVSRLILKLDNLDHEGVKGSVLVFLPGIGEIGALRDLLQSSLNTQIEKNWMIFDLHSNVDPDDQKLLFVSGDPNIRRIILATNIAESSITLPNIRYVIDFCLTKRLVHDDDTNSSYLDLQLASKHQCIQRAGRTGRTGPGFVFRIAERNFFDSLKEQSDPEMKTCGLGLVFLWLKKLEMGEPIQLLQYALDPPSDIKFQSCVEALKECGALHLYMNDGSFKDTDGEVSVVGELATLLSLDPKFARLVAFGHVFGFLKEAVVLAATLCNHSIFHVPTSTSARLRSWESKIDFSGHILSDAFAEIAALKLYSGLKANPKKSDLLKQVYLRQSNLRNVEFTINNIFKKLHREYGVMFGTQFKNIDATYEWMIQGQLFIAASSYPNLFYKTKVRSQQEFMEKVKQDVAMCDPLRSVYLLPSFFSSVPPSQDNFNSIATKFKQLLRLKFPPVMLWEPEKGRIVVEFNQQETQQGFTSFPVYMACKLKGLKFQFFYTDENKSRILCEGPNSPLSMNFMNFNNSQYQKIVYTDQNSAAFINIDDHWHRSSSYIMAALKTSKSSATNRLVVKHGTRLCPVSGLFTMLNLLFSPRISLRKKKNVPGFTSAVCGLGLSPISNKPIASARNLDCLFDFDILNQDIQKINTIRSHMDELLLRKNFMKENEEIEILRQVFLDDVYELIHSKRNPNRDRTCVPQCEWGEGFSSLVFDKKRLFPAHQY